MRFSSASGSLSGLDIAFDAMNLTERIFSGGTTFAEYAHLADGTKLCAVDGNGDGYQYRGSLIYSQTANQSGAVSLALDCALTAGGRIVRVNGADRAGGTASFRVLHYLRDHLGSVRAIVDGDSGDVIEANDYYPFGKRIAIAADPEHDEGSPSAAVPTSASAGSATAQSVASSNRWLFSGKESQSFLSTDIPLLDFGARMYDPITARWTTADPLADKYYGISPYGYCAGDPIVYSDILGLRPIYSTDGILLGTDDGGLQGEQIIMEKSHFIQGMQMDEALKYNLGLEGLDGEDAISRFIDSFNHLKDRPDWDGYITLKEANEWYRFGDGKPLFADINKINFDSYVSLGEKYVGKEYVINLLTGSLNINDGLVYGKITVKRYPNHGIRAYGDHYDFDIKKPYLLHIGRNIQTLIGLRVAGKGIPYNINIYGEKKLKPISP